MSDGPNYEQLFLQRECLNAVNNLKEIVNYLRFYKDSDEYQNFLRHYLPLLKAAETEAATAAFNEFVEDVENEELFAELTEKKAKKVKEPVVDPVQPPVVDPVVTPTEPEVTADPRADREAELNKLGTDELKAVLVSLGLPEESNKPKRVAAVLAKEFPVVA